MNKAEENIPKPTFSACSIPDHHCKCFDRLSDQERKFLDNHSVRVSYKKGETLCKQGGFVSHVMFVESGLVKVFLEDANSSLVLKIITDGNLVGLSSVSEKLNTFQYSAVAYIDTVVRQIDVSAIRSLISQNALFARDLIDIMAFNATQIYGRFFCLTQKQSYGRMSDILLCLADRVFRNTSFDLPITRKELAELTSMSQETVIRILGKFEQDKLIRIKGKNLSILDYERLQKISNNG